MVKHLYECIQMPVFVMYPSGVSLATFDGEGRRGSLRLMSRYINSPLKNGQKRILEDEEDGKSYMISPVCMGQDEIVYVVIDVTDNRKNQEFNERIVRMMSELTKIAVRMQKIPLEQFRNIKDAFGSRIIFGEGKEQYHYIEDQYEKNYFVAILTSLNTAALKGLENKYYESVKEMIIKTEEQKIYIWGYHKTAKKMDAFYRIYEDFEGKSQVAMAVSEMYSNINVTECKIKMLQYILHMKKNVPGMYLEQECYLDVIHDCTADRIGNVLTDGDELSRIKELDKEKSTDLYNTLRAYLKSGNNIAETAKHLYIHRNTLIYRLRKIQELLGEDMDDITFSRNLLFQMEVDEAKEKRK